MQLAAVTPEQAETIVAVLGAVVTARGTADPTAADHAVLQAAATELLGGAPVPDDLGGSIPGIVAEQLTDPATRELALAIATVLCFTDAPDDDTTVVALDPVRVMIVDDLARYLRVSALSVVEVRRRAKEQHDTVVFDVGRRSTVAPDARPMTETHIDIDARRVHALWDRIGDLPSGTVGAELLRYYFDHGWRYPGTDHHEPLTLAAHDLHHVIGGYPTTPAGELGLAAFTAGATGTPLAGVLSLLTWVHVGGVTAQTVTDVASPAAAAFERGARTTGAFVAAGWDPWLVVDRDLAALRAEYQIDGTGTLTPGDAYDVDPVAADR